MSDRIPRWRRNKNGAKPWLSKFDTLARYNSERDRGITHTPEWDERMAALQAEFYEWRDGAATGGVAE